MSCAIKRAFSSMKMPAQQHPLDENEIEGLREQLSNECLDVLAQLREATRQMERANIKECVEKARSELGKKRFTVQHALGKGGARGALEVLEQSVPLGLSLSMSASEVRSVLRDRGQHELAERVSEAGGGCEGSKITARELGEVADILACAGDLPGERQVLWAPRVERQSEGKLWMLDQHYQ